MLSGESSYCLEIFKQLLGVRHSTALLPYCISNNLFWLCLSGDGETDTLYTNRQYLLPYWCWKIAWKEAEKANCHLLCLPFEDVVTVTDGSAARLLQEKPFWLGNIILFSFQLWTNLKHTPENSRKVSTCCFLFFFFIISLANIPRNNMVLKWIPTSYKFNHGSGACLQSFCSNLHPLEFSDGLSA